MTTKTWTVATVVQAASGGPTVPGPTFSLEADTADVATVRAVHKLRNIMAASGEAPAASIGAYAALPVRARGVAR